MNESFFTTCIIGAGPAGLMAAIYAARTGVSVCLLERNNSPGRKLLLTGGGRCNLTHTGGIDDFVRACRPYGHLLKAALHTLSPDELVDFFHQQGLRTVIETDGCVFPDTGRAQQVCRTLTDQAKTHGARFEYSQRVLSIQKQIDVFRVRTERDVFTCASLVIATGGVSWPGTGSTGDGYAIAAALGHTIVKPTGILCPVICRQDWPGTLQGTSLPQVTIRVRVDGTTQKLSGALVFTANGIGGPAAFDVSRAAACLLRQGGSVPIRIDFCPDLEPQRLDAKLIDLFAANPSKDLPTVLSSLIPKRMAQRFAQMVYGQDPIQAGQITKDRRRKLVLLLKEAPLTVIRSGPIEKATVTQGGVERSEIDFKTMQSRKCEGLYFAGEVIDIDGPCGGYNLQIAFSTGALAGIKAAEYGIKKSPEV